MKSYWIYFLAIWGALNCKSQQVSALVTNYSSTGQFVIYGVPLQKQNQPSSILTPSPFIKVDPSLLAVSCERTKQQLIGLLGCDDQWRGRIHILVQFTVATNRPVSIESSLFAGRWRYRMLLPDEIEKTKLVRAIVNVILLEMVNRQSGTKMAEVPLWLMEGFTRLVLTSSSDKILLEPHSLISKQVWKQDPMQIAQNEMKILNPLTLEQLSFPEPETFYKNRWIDFQATSHLFVLQLLRLPKGQQAMQEMLSLFPAYENWQLAFLQAYRNHFRSILEAEKWWSLVIANLHGFDRLHGWDDTYSWNKLDEVLRLPIWVQITINDIPHLTFVPIQQLVQQWEESVYRPILWAKRNQIKALRMHASPKFAPLLEAYIQILTDYFDTDQKPSKAPKEIPGSSSRLIRKELLRKLIEIETQRQSLRPESILPNP